MIFVDEWEDSHFYNSYKGNNVPMTEKEMDYLFDLHGYLILRNAISKADLVEMNQWVDDHWEYVENRPDKPTQQWVGNVELHSYGSDDGVNFQNIIEGCADL